MGKRKWSDADEKKRPNACFTMAILAGKLSRASLRADSLSSQGIVAIVAPPIDQSSCGGGEESGQSMIGLYVLTLQKRLADKTWTWWKRL